MEEVTIIIIITVCCSGTHATKDGQRKEPYQYYKRNFIDVTEFEVIGNSDPMYGGGYARDLHNPQISEKQQIRLHQVLQ